ncbi:MULTISPECIES: hypothetical protein [unclassified Psychrobacillus]|uniref:hypothetical protein n=1 Tax=Psychrobacillus TaxID=1221880 RepID=UPI00146B1699|nr:MULTISPECIES: hypothetical protein [unclassified Psychrobacillus]MCM3360306.1 hypothetical protein [Psychrobacillus sp. MER TA 171]NME07837.1 hypothetical protein [Psychrobacillus sp. BL-248-WT-3]
MTIKLNEVETKLFERVHAKHLSVIGNEEKTKYQKEEIVKIERDIRNKCLKVYFRNGEWFRYFTDGTWG